MSTLPLGTEVRSASDNYITENIEFFWFFNYRGIGLYPSEGEKQTGVAGEPPRPTPFPSPDNQSENWISHIRVQNPPPLTGVETSFFSLFFNFSRTFTL